MTSSAAANEAMIFALLIIFALPYLLWRLGRTDHYAPLVVVQIIAGILLGPGVVGALFPDAHASVLTPDVIRVLDGIGKWAVMLFVFLAGVELDLSEAWKGRRDTVLTASMALGTPLLFGTAAAFVMLQWPGWTGPAAAPWQAALGIGLACSVTALPILVLFMERLSILRQPLGQRILRYASIDDIAVWTGAALILFDWSALGRQMVFLVGLVGAGWAVRRAMVHIPDADRIYVALIWMPLVAFAAEWGGLHFMVGAFLAGAVIDRDMVGAQRTDIYRQVVLIALMPVFFLSTGLRTQWDMGGAAVSAAAALLLLAAVADKLAGVHLAGRLLGWPRGEASIIGWLLQTKALIMIILANILLDRALISNGAFTALLVMAVGSTMLTMPIVRPLLARLGGAPRGD